MAYDSRYDASSGYVMDGVLAFCQPYLSGGTAFVSTTQPTLTQVEQFIDHRVSEVAAALAGFGYATAQPVGTVGTDVARVLSQAVIFGALIDIEATKITTTVDNEESPRWQLFKARHKHALGVVGGPGLQLMGATRERNLSDTLVVTGRTWSEQDAIANDSDEKGALFPRGFIDQLARQTSTVEITDPAND